MNHFKCDECGKTFPHIEVNGMPVGDRLLEGVTFIVKVNDDGMLDISVSDDAKEYFSQLNTEYWLAEVKLFVLRNWGDVIAGCPFCKDDIIPAEDFVGILREQIIKQPEFVPIPVKLSCPLPDFVKGNIPEGFTANRQPFYHRVEGILFTATRGIAEQEFTKALISGLSTISGVIPSSIQIEVYNEPEPGDPYDLM